MTAKLRLENKVAVVTGAGRGIGRAEALLLAANGAKVVVNDLGGAPTGGGGDRSFAENVVSEIIAAGGVAVAETSSIASMQGGQAVIDAALDHFGRLDILINNAGILRPSKVQDLSEEDWDVVHDVNLKGYFATIRAAARIFIEQRTGGVIVNTSSASGLGHYGMSAYSAAKEGVIGLTRSVARDLGQFGVRCNAIRPSSSLTNMKIPLLEQLMAESVELGMTGIWNRTARSPIPSLPEHVAALAVWLCTDATAHVSGREFYVQGGEIGLFPEVEVMRSTFNPAGWDIESLDDPGVAEQLVGDIKNRYVRMP